MTHRQIPSISELRIITQTAKSHNKNWHYTIHRQLSIYLTWLLLHFRLNANQVTILSFLCGILGAMLIIFGGQEWSLFGLFLFYIYFLLDKVDGEIARFRKQQSLRGICLDYIGHLIIPPLVPLSIGGFLSKQLAIDTFWLLGVLAALSITFLRIGPNIPVWMIMMKSINEPDIFTKKPINLTSGPSQTSLSHKKLIARMIAVKNIIHFFISFWQSIFLLIISMVIYLLWQPGIWLFIGIFLFLSFAYISFASIMALRLTQNIEQHLCVAQEQILQTSKNIISNQTQHNV